jgi:large subunit ribosomal protein L30
VLRRSRLRRQARLSKPPSPVRLAKKSPAITEVAAILVVIIVAAVAIIVAAHAAVAAVIIVAAHAAVAVAHLVADRRKQAMAKLRIKWVKSAIGHPKDQKETIRALGLRKLQRTVELDDQPAVRGMIRKVSHLVQVEEILA